MRQNDATIFFAVGLIRDDVPQMNRFRYVVDEVNSAPNLVMEERMARVTDRCGSRPNSQFWIGN